MSYCTARNETLLIQMRLSIATQSEAINDPELQILVTKDVRTILLRKPDMKPTLVAAYRDASPEGKRFIETAVAQLDPSFAAELRVSKYGSDRTNISPVIRASPASCGSSNNTRINIAFEHSRMVPLQSRSTRLT